MENTSWNSLSYYVRTGSQSKQKVARQVTDNKQEPPLKKWTLMKSMSSRRVNKSWDICIRNTSCWAEICRILHIHTFSITSNLSFATPHFLVDIGSLYSVGPPWGFILSSFMMKMVRWVCGCGSGRGMEGVFTVPWFQMNFHSHACRACTFCLEYYPTWLLRYKDFTGS